MSLQSPPLACAVPVAQLGSHLQARSALPSSPLQQSEFGVPGIGAARSYSHEMLEVKEM